MSRVANALAFVGFVTFAYSITEIVFALRIGSLALLSDGFHNFGDFASIGLAWFAERAKLRERDGNNTFGFARAEYLGAFANVRMHAGGCRAGRCVACAHLPVFDTDLLVVVVGVVCHARRHSALDRRQRSVFRRHRFLSCSTPH